MSHAAKIAVVIARVFVVLALLALVGAWGARMNDGSLFGLSELHLFNDASWPGAIRRCLLA